EAIRQLGAGTAAMIGSLGPVVTLLLAWLLLGEPLGTLQLLGAALVIGGVVWIVLRPHAEAPPVTGWLDARGGGGVAYGGAF
ncbi:MAG TPA: EamA family transporter, partial [Kofleriaceae bacterium]|nr:EamA family transporter [Kofleriaceae bacterium]